MKFRIWVFTDFIKGYKELDNERYVVFDDSDNSIREYGVHAVTRKSLSQVFMKL